MTSYEQVVKQPINHEPSRRHVTSVMTSATAEDDDDDDDDDDADDDQMLISTIKATKTATKTTHEFVQITCTRICINFADCLFQQLHSL